MFIFNNDRLSDLFNSVCIYVRNNYEDPSQTVNVSEADAGIMHQEREEIYFSIQDTNTQYSLRDSYDAEKIRLVMNAFSSSASTLKALKELEDSTNISFVNRLLEYINAKQLRDSDVYKAAQIDRKLFSKIVSDRSYKPAKDTCIALCLALRLTLFETNDLLSRAGYTLSHSNKRDVILEYFIRERVYDLNDVNEILYRLEQKTLGR